MDTCFLDCPAKINLTLRITGREESGFHKLCSLFYKIGQVDNLTINPGMVDNVKVIFKRKKSIMKGQNILLKTLDKARSHGIEVPPLEMELYKNVPPGTGLGAGSGDAAALLGFLEGEGFPVMGFADEIGSDVPFLCGQYELALVEGRGEILTPLKGGLGLACTVVIPKWSCPTAEMFAAADLHFADGWPTDGNVAEEEIFRVLDCLRGGKKFGLLPNDFCPVLVARHPEYAELFDLFDCSGAIAWGVSGSGSSAFALWDKGSFLEFRNGFEWIEDVLIF